jgi:phosphoribosylanthranilate isomerase
MGGMALADPSQSGAPGIARDILKYFQRNPQAADSLEGIARWRLLDEQIHRSVQEAGQSLDWLVAKGFLLKDSTQASGTLYMLNTEKAAEIAQFLAQISDSEAAVKKEER